ncbi:methyltransferase domain-containing protein [Gilvimarinus agarilyticus]|uniref:methyltransferase domain-containing protein n=1 Tax=Gilvimarinus sp. 2_MG-2023 TaxID=3062666 RepID=UPI001C08BC7E|nr:methyltransferase domain-containing protein [Gilvimarinus sp. 2_MG-2023]MBU2884974.1 methyltransferase domain-containing protein [Gilvimarinus agarilyticus]MDO6569871.1 methyltransferase domain-containing protein [Gilvimarinus sp. 2_MG-2023]
MMIEARQQFLNAGFYAPLVDALAEVCGQYGISSLLDAGCGEGYYSTALSERGLQVAGLDISKEGIMACSRRRKSMPWCIASVADMPYMNASFDAVLSIFCRVEPTEFARVTKPGGYMIYVGPTESHLSELRNRLYDEVRSYESDKPEQYFSGFEQLQQRTVTIPLQLESAEQIENLLKMTPHYWSTNRQQQERLFSAGPLIDQADIQIRVYQVPSDKTESVGAVG